MVTNNPDFHAPALMKAVAFASLVTLALAAAFPPRAATQEAATSRAQVQFTAPFLAAAGEHVLVCAANVSAATGNALPLHVTLELLSAVTGVVMRRGELVLPPLGGVEHPPNPCIEFAVTGGDAPVPSPSLLLAAVELNPQPLPPGFRLPRLLTAAVQIFTPDAVGVPVRGVAFLPPSPCLSAACRPSASR